MISQISFKRFKPSNPFIQKYIEHYWFISSEDIVSFEYEMLPSTSIDIILDLNSQLSTIANPQNLSNPSIFLSAVNDRYYLLKLQGRIDIMGILFRPGMASSLVLSPLAQLSGICDDSVLPPGFTISLKRRIRNSDLIEDRIKNLEKVLCNWLDPGKSPPDFFLHIYQSMINEGFTIHEIAESFKLNRRTIERSFRNFTGVSPGKCMQIQRMQSIIVGMINGKPENSIQDDHSGRFYDQSHFIHLFKRYAHLPPGRFQNVRRKDNRCLSSAIDIYSSSFSDVF